MPQPPNKALRIIVPILLLIGGVLIAWAIYVNSNKQVNKSAAAKNANPAAVASANPADATKPPPGNVEEKPKPADGAEASKPVETAAGGERGGERGGELGPGVTTPSGPTSAPASTPAAPATKTATYSAVFHGGTFPTFAAIGDLKDPYRLEVRFSPLGAGISAIDMTGVYATIARTSPERLQFYVPHPTMAGVGVVPFALDGVEINGEFVPLFGKPGQEGSFWTQTVATPTATTFEAVINDAAGVPAAKVTRTYKIEPQSYDLIVEQRAANLTAQPLTITWRTWGPADLDKGLMRGSTDYRRLRFGYLSDPSIDPTQQLVVAEKFVESRSHWLGNPTGGTTGMRTWDSKVLWPNPTSTERKLTPVWVAMTNRHFAVAMHTLVPPAAGGGTQTYAKPFNLAASVERFVLDGTTPSNETMVTYLRSAPVTVPPGQSGIFDAGIYAGPLSPAYMTEKAEPRAAAVTMSKIIVYTMGGPCWWCTFQWLTHPLQWFLTFLHDHVVFDYALAIVVLVVCVRTLLHPVTKWSQVNMMKFSKQMAGLAPKQKKIQEKYKDDPLRMRQEMASLMREENISYKGLLGCLPAFLQSPIWIALYAMLFFMYELRHEPAFFGVFQSLSTAVTGHSWNFLADLSEPDHFISLGAGVRVPIFGLIDSINVLPILLGVVFYVQQKYLTPPPTTQLTPEQEQQQKIVKVMMVVLFPLMMYTTPSALVLYFIVNSTLGTLESRYIRRHIDQKALLEPKPDVVDRYNKPGSGKNAKKPGFFQRLQQMAEERARQIEEAKRGPRRK